MKKLITLVLAVLILTTPLCDADNQPESQPALVPQPSTPAGPSENAAKIVLNAPSTAKIGELVRLDASASTASSFKWLTNPSTQDFEVYADGRKAVFSARKAGSYQFVLAVGLKDTVDVIEFTIRVEGPVDPPTSDSLEEWIPYWMSEMHLPAEEKEALAVSFEQIALKMTVLATPEAIIKATAEANRAALGANLSAWIPLLQKIQVSLEKLARSGKMTTPQQHAEVWASIARGIRKG